MQMTTITSKGQVTIPRDVRESMGASSGDRVLFTPSANGTAVLSVVSGNVTTSLFGSITNRVRAAGHQVARSITARELGKKYQIP